MATIILSAGYEVGIRSRLSVKPSELPDSDINIPSIVNVAEAIVARKVGDYTLITDPIDKSLLESAVIAYICYLLCPTMGNRVKSEVTTLDVKWKKGKVDWAELAKRFLEEVEVLIAQIETAGYEATIFRIAKATTDGEA